MHSKFSPPALTTSARVTGIIATVVAFVVIAGTALIVSPAGTPLRSEVRSVALPYFGQTWRVFAPNIMKVDRTLQFRAGWLDEDGNMVKSDWVNLTQIEQRVGEGNPFPSRIQKPSWNVSGTYLNRYRALEAEQQKRARDTFIQATGDGFAAIPVEELIADLGEGDGDVIRYLRMDYMLMRHITLFATAGFDEKIERIQWRVVRERPNDFTHRFDEEQQFQPTVETFGWRQSTAVVEPAVLSEYRALIARNGGSFEFQEARSEAE